MDSAGRRTEAFGSGFEAGGDVYQLAFATSASATGFTIHYPGNDPIELDV